MTKTTRISSRSIGVKPATNALHGVRLAVQQGRSPNLLVTINLSRLGVGVEESSHFFSRVRKSTHRAWKYRRDRRGENIGAMTDVFTHENPCDNPHVHWLIYVPPGLEDWFRSRLDAVIQKMAGLDDLGSALNFVDVERPGGVMKYMLKGVQPMYGPYFHIRPVDQGVVVGRRTFTSRAIGAAARRAANWQRKQPQSKGDRDHEATRT